jgi:hypothetical protein
LRKDIRKFIRECEVCQRNKTKNLKPAGALQPLPIPSKVWVDISMDFIKGLPLSKGYNVIMMIVDKFSKYSNFIPMTYPYTTTTVAKAFMKNIFKLYDIP